MKSYNDYNPQIADIEQIDNNNNDVIQNNNKQEQQQKSKAKTSSKVETKNINWLQKSINFLKSDTCSYLIGIIALALGAYLLVSFISFIKEGAADQSIIDNSALASTHNVKNIGGEGGARLAQYLINDCFGLSSMVLIIWLFVISIKSFYRKIKIKVLDFTLKSAISLVVVSLIVGFFTINLSSHFNWGGYHGKIVNEFIHNFIGQTGAIILCLLLIGIFVILCLSDIIKWLYKIQKIKEQRRQEALVLQQEEELKEKRVQQMSLLSDDDASNRENVDDNKEETINNQLSFSEDYDISDEIDNNISEILEEEVLAAQEDTYSILEDNEIAEKMTVNVNNIAEADNLDKKPEVYDPTAELSRYKFPSYDLLNQINSKISVDEAEQIENKERIRKTLLDFNIPITSIEATVGPTVTLYEVRPDNGIKISKIRGLVDDIALSLAATGVRIIAPIPGKGTVGIEVANRDPQTVSMRTIITSKKFQENKYELPIALGSTISNEVCMADLSKMPHLLVAGATGQGKSVGLNTIITSLLYSKHPAELKFVLIDPKMVEFSLYSKLEKHYLAKLPDSEEAIITDTQKVVATLNSLCQEMDDRYSLLMKCGARTIKEYNSKFINRVLNPEKGHRFLPYIVVIVDEFSDLIMTAGKEVETPIARITQKARAVGIHMIIATQRPSTNVITGLIKANCPARIAFKVTSGVDSKTILDTVGAQQLIGRGDMLLSNGSEMTRVQCAFIDTPEVEAICEHINGQVGYPNAYILPEPIIENDTISGGGSGSNFGDRDEYFDEIARMIVNSNTASTSSLQRRYNIGYNRAGRIMDQLEAAGIVGPSQGGKPRAVLVDAITLETILGDKNS